MSLPIWDDSPHAPPHVALCGTVWHSLGRASSPNANPANDFRRAPAYSGTTSGDRPRQAPRSTPETVASFFEDYVPVRLVIEFARRFLRRPSHEDSEDCRLAVCAIFAIIVQPSSAAPIYREDSVNARPNATSGKTQVTRMTDDIDTSQTSSKSKKEDLALTGRPSRWNWGNRY